MTDASPGTGRPLFSVVSACYQVADFLPAYIASIEAQDIDPRRLEVVMVDDGSTDDTSRLLAEWAARRPELVRVVRQDNAGQGAARNAGIDVATGEWVTFPDPDDVLAPDYFSRVAAFLAKHPSSDMVAANRWLMDDRTGESEDKHPLAGQFRGDTQRNLAVHDRFFHGGAPSAFVRSTRLAESGLRFDPRIRPNFEDGHFCARYLLASEEPLVGFVGSAVYHYRKRQDGTSSLQNALSNPGRYTDVLRLGYLDVLERAEEAYGQAPLWLQNFILYELSYYLGREDGQVGTLAPPAVREEFHALVARIVEKLAPEVVMAYVVTRMSPLTRAVLLHGWSSEPWVSDEAVVTAHDPEQGLVRLTYRYAGDAPTEELLLGTRAVVPTAAKTRDVMIQGRAVLHERIIWAPSRRLRLRVGGRHLPILLDPPERQAIVVRPHLLEKRPDPAQLLEPAPGPELTREEQAVLRASQGRRRRERYRDAWVLMDRIHNADDSAEHLFAHLRTKQPGTNAWFVVEAGTPDWKRLRKAYGDRVVAHGGKEWMALMLNATHLISSHADAAVVDPPALRPFAPLKRRFTFLQHGVIKDDLSGWLNRRDIDLFVTSTQPEYESIVGDHTAYRVTSKEAVLTGLPRFDLLHRAGRRFPPEQRDLLLVSPTWREYLVPQLEAGSQRRTAYDWILESHYMKSWTGLLASPELAELAARHGLRIAILPHPNMEAALDAAALPAHVERLSFDDEVDVRELFARAAVLVTDYSSTAFNSAYIARPVVYFQFDADELGEARHVGLPGYFDYARDGFGPVTHTIEEAVAEITATVDFGREPRAPWSERMDATFGFRDDQCCARVLAEIKRMEKRRRLVLADRPGEAPS
ncbi:bifunctional glycosyltransferase/CDP-glycerol:glycerophosphate glycerophosphotransferase [Nocardioides gilvus]|uniref:bifunctional glycosyltransferase/CDP-glycerol:glycerophosphate glycerophosphotransferase n=1 Tax=Nocardioides gilvus TaxID=1735589 RepID=UPI000D750529|nr:CDP-glycerol glycerophosphotransferase family protein [Nocardioides gilvus]